MVHECRVELQDKAGLSELITRFAPDVVFHLAAIVDTVATPDIARLYATNIMGTVNLVEALRESDSRAKIIFASSAFAYGRAQEGQPVVESQPLRPITPYGASKAAAEAIVLQFARETDAFVIVTRAFQQTGPGHSGAYALADWAKQIAELAVGVGAGSIRCGNIEVVRDYLDVRDVASAYRALADSGHRNEIYNVASGKPRTMRSLLEGLTAAAGVSPPIERDMSRLRQVDQAIFYGDPSKLREHTGWTPKVPIQQTLADLVDFWRERVCDRSATLPRAHEPSGSG